METPSNGEDPAQRAHDIGRQIAEGVLAGQKEKQQAGFQQLWDGAGKLLRWGVIAFFVPFVALYAWGGMAPEAWGEQGYWPLVAGFYVLRAVVSVLRDGTWGEHKS